MKCDNLKSGSDIKLATSGSPLKVTVGRPENKKQRQEIKKISIATLKELCLNLDLSKTSCKELISTINKNTETPVIERCFLRELKAAEDKIKDLYDVHSLTLDIAAGKEKEQRSLVVVQNCFTFIHNLIEERKLVANKTMVRISIDGGQGFLKICANVFEPGNNRPNAKYSDSGVQKIQILAIVEDCNESYDNLKTILELLNLDSLGFSIGIFLIHTCFTL